MSQQKKSTYGIQEVQEQQSLEVAGVEKEVTHTATNLPVDTYALEPPTEFR